MSIIDNFIKLFSPSLALKRSQNRAALALVDTQKRRYEGATKGRRAKNWRTNGYSQNTDLRLDLATLRNRSRDLGRNNPYAKKAVQAIANNTIGLGVRPKPFNMSASAERKLKSAWMDWAEKIKCDYDDNLTFYGIQKLVMRSLAESGEVIIVKKYENRELKLQVLESDHIDTTRDSTNELGYSVMGIQFNSNGKKIGYWLYDNHPGEFNRVSDTISKFYKKEDVLHIFEVLRPGQVRGVPFGVSAMLRLRDFDEYEDAQLVRQKIAACFTVFVQDTASTEFTDEDADILERVEPGIIEVLPPGKSVTFSNPPGTGTDYGPYTTKVLQAVAAGYGVPYEILTTDLSNVNFSSGRMGWLEFHKNIEDWQENIIIPKLCSPVWDWFIEWQITKGNLKNNISATWTTPRRAMIDPDKETKSTILAIQGGLKSWQQALRELGYDPDDVALEFDQDYKMMDKLGLKLKSDYRNETAEILPTPNE
jgi:lambda family phage portal protein